MKFTSSSPNSKKSSHYEWTNRLQQKYFFGWIVLLTCLYICNKNSFYCGSIRWFLWFLIRQAHIAWLMATMATEPPYPRSFNLTLKNDSNINFNIEIHKRVVDGPDMEQKVTEKVCRTFGINSRDVQSKASCVTRIVSIVRSPTELTTL